MLIILKPYVCLYDEILMLLRMSRGTVGSLFWPIPQDMNNMTISMREEGRVEKYLVLWLVGI